MERREGEGELEGEGEKERKNERDIIWQETENTERVIQTINTTENG